MTDADRQSTDAASTHDAKDGAPQQESPSEPPVRGADMARAALDAARQRNAAARSARHKSGRSTGVGADAVEGSAVKRLRRRRWSGPGADAARDPQLFGDIAQRWIARADAGGDIVKARLFAGWAEIVGADIAAHAQPVELIDQELTVQAESTAWATQLRLLAPGMVKKINTALGHGTVTRIRTKGPTAPSWRFGNRHVPGRGPRDTYG
jgi:predicted nucleic acid-binding Zn ribbon protein